MAARKKAGATKKKKSTAARKKARKPAGRKAAKKSVKKTRKTARKAATGRKPARKKTPARKAARAPVKAKRKAPARGKKQTAGEGDYEASRAFLKDQADFVRKNKADIPAMGRQAEAALDGPEGDALRDAEAAGQARSRDMF